MAHSQSGGGLFDWLCRTDDTCVQIPELSREFRQLHHSLLQYKGGDSFGFLSQELFHTISKKIKSFKYANPQVPLDTSAEMMYLLHSILDRIHKLSLCWNTLVSHKRIGLSQDDAFTGYEVIKVAKSLETDICEWDRARKSFLIEKQRVEHGGIPYIATLVTTAGV